MRLELNYFKLPKTVLGEKQADFPILSSFSVLAPFYMNVGQVFISYGFK